MQSRVTVILTGLDFQERVQRFLILMSHLRSLAIQAGRSGGLDHGMFTEVGACWGELSMTLTGFPGTASDQDREREGRVGHLHQHLPTSGLHPCSEQDGKVLHQWMSCLFAKLFSKCNVSSPFLGVGIFVKIDPLSQQYQGSGWNLCSLTFIKVEVCNPLSKDRV